ncbi:MAG: carbon-nitrogen hydrolase family protein [Deltaproteobacteria bacterium]|nr:carbon-nitrogen hydrolase family protein [Deltaproteobacteria bacterium]
MTAPRALAAAQIVPIRGDVGANLAAHVRAIHAAASEGARVLVFPELSLTGYELDLGERLAFTADDARLAPLRDLATAKQITLVVGAPVRLGEKLHIGAFLLSADGAIDVYTKHHLGAFSADANLGGPIPPPESDAFVPGDRNPLVHFDGHTAAVAVCADIHGAPHAGNAARRGASTYLAGMFVIPAHLEFDLLRLRDIATKHAMAVVFANFGGPTGGLPAAGGSAILSPSGEVLVQLPPSGSGIAIATDTTETVETEAGWRAKTILLDAP